MDPISTQSRVSFDDTEIAFSYKNDKELRLTHFIFKSMNNNFLVNVGTSLIKLSLKLRLPVKGIIRKTIFQQFCGGENIEQCEKSIKKLSQFGVGTILDYSVEGESTDASFDATVQEIIRTIKKAAGNKSIPFSVFKVTGVAATPLLEKVQSKAKLTDSEQRSFELVKKRVDAICSAAYENRVRLFIDAEETWIQEVIDDLCYEMMEKYNREQAIVYNTFQLYTKACLGRFKKAYAMAEEKGYFLGGKLVRGAYMEKERARAEEKGYENPIQPSKEACDNDYNEALKFSVENKHRIAICAGSHNEFSSYLLTVLMEKNGIAPSDPNFFFAQLYGMSDHISFNLAKAGYNVAKYLPYGPVGSVMPYLFRRAKENTSVKGQSSREFRLVSAEMKRRKAAKKR